MLRFALRHAANAWRSPARAVTRLVATNILPRSRLGSAPEPITALDQVSARWLTDTLRSNGFLDRGEVSFVHQHGVQRRRASVTCHLALRYSADATTTAPADLFLKLPPDDHEVRFYRTVAHDMRHLPVARCLGSALGDSQNRPYLLLDDLSKTHCINSDPERSVDSLALVHAHWWTHHRLSDDIGMLPTDESIQNDVEMTRERVAQFERQFGHLLPRARVKMYRDIMSFYPRLLHEQRREPLTVVHGDAHRWNFLSPTANSSEPPILIDWEAWGVGVGANDLGKLIAGCRSLDLLARDEMNYVRRYHDGLLAGGVRDYDWPACWSSYRRSLVRTLVVILKSSWWEASREHLWRMLEKATVAFEDLGCTEFLETT